MILGSCILYDAVHRRVDDLSIQNLFVFLDAQLRLPDLKLGFLDVLFLIPNRLSELFRGVFRAIVIIVIVVVIVPHLTFRGHGRRNIRRILHYMLGIQRLHLIAQEGSQRLAGEESIVQNGKLAGEFPCSCRRIVNPDAFRQAGIFVHSRSQSSFICLRPFQIKAG